MLRSRMFTPGFKLFFGIALLLLLSGWVFGISSSLQAPGSSISEQLKKTGIIATVTGPLSLGYKGPVGNHLGYMLLLAAAALAAFLALVLVAFRDADPEAGAQVLQVETVPLTRAPSGTNYAPLVAAFSLGLVALGLVVGSVLFYAGLTLLALTAGGWTVRAWAERATGDAEVNRQIYARLIDPLRVPVVALVVIGFVVVGLSRVLLAVPDENWSRVIFGLAAIVFFGGVLAVYFSPRIARPLATALLIIGALAVLGGAIYGVAKGGREIEGHGEAPGAVSEHGLGAPGGALR
jgi:hypothetical protein